MLLESESIMEKKYEITKNGADDYTLKYKDQEIKFKSSIQLVNDIQEANKKARIKMIMELSKEGMSLKDFIKEEKKDGKTYYDNTNKAELEKIYIEQETGQIFMDTIKNMLGKDYQDLISEIGLETEQEILEFSELLGKAIVGRFPS